MQDIVQCPCWALNPSANFALRARIKNPHGDSFPCAALRAAQNVATPQLQQKKQNEKEPDWTPFRFGVVVRKCNSITNEDFGANQPNLSLTT